MRDSSPCPVIGWASGPLLEPTDAHENHGKGGLKRLKWNSLMYKILNLFYHFRPLFMALKFNNFRRRNSLFFLQFYFYNGSVDSDHRGHWDGVSLTGLDG